MVGMAVSDANLCQNLVGWNLVGTPFVGYLALAWVSGCVRASVGGCAGTSWWACACVRAWVRALVHAWLPQFRYLSPVFLEDVR